MSGERATEPIVIAIEVGEPGLADRLTALLADVPGVRLAGPGEVADVVLALPDPSSQSEPDAGLTPRETDVLALLAEGASNKTIARRLGISVHTAKFHVGSLLDEAGHLSDHIEIQTEESTMDRFHNLLGPLLGASREEVRKAEKEFKAQRRKNGRRNARLRGDDGMWYRATAVRFAEPRLPGCS